MTTSLLRSSQSLMQLVLFPDIFDVLPLEQMQADVPQPRAEEPPQKAQAQFQLPLFPLDECHTQIM